MLVQTASVPIKPKESSAKINSSTASPYFCGFWLLADVFKMRNIMLNSNKKKGQLSITQAAIYHTFSVKSNMFCSKLAHSRTASLHWKNLSLALLVSKIITIRIFSDHSPDVL